MIYIILFAPVVFALCFAAYPLQGNDEWGHFLRAIDVSYGNITDFKGIKKNNGESGTVEGPDTLVPFVTDPSMNFINYFPKMLH
ncbi:hypothetical protein ABK905_18230 [Acerihabitans sp. KWT182]|uniref:Uncharacterized protein n=1 Tax=Acerihabitans sp. KWT182 TaxID=3157919 RepID=A0AAU7Q8N4_9GAMM